MTDVVLDYASESKTKALLEKLVADYDLRHDLAVAAIRAGQDDRPAKALAELMVAQHQTLADNLARGLSFYA